MCLYIHVVFSFPQFRHHNQRKPVAGSRKRFPYMAVYGASENRIDVLAPVSVRRDPEWIEATVAGRAEW